MAAVPAVQHHARMARRGVRAGTGLAITAIVLSATAACIREPAPQPPPEKSAWQKVMDLAGPDGQVGTDMAVQAFALSVGPLPGVAVPSGPPGPVTSGTAATSWVLQHWADLTSAQRRQVDSYLGLGLPVDAGPAGRLGRAAPLTPRKPADLPSLTCDRPAGQIPAKPAVEAGQAQVGALVALLESRLEVQFDVRLVICLAAGDLPSRPGPGGTVSTTAAVTAAFLHNDNSLDCAITLYQSAQQSAEADRRRTLLHELMHCYMARMTATPAMRFPPFPAWVSEGISEWTADQLSGIASTHWPTYLTHPETELVHRSYDAVGFYAHLQDTHHQMWKVIPDIVRKSVEGDRTNSEAAFAAAVAPGRTAALDTLPSSWLRQPKRGSPASGGGVGPWDMTGPRIPRDWAVRPHLGAVRNDGPDVAVNAAAWASDLVEVDVRADVVTISTTGDVHGRFGPGKTGDYPLSTAVSTLFCAKSGGCRCKDATAPPAFVAIDAGLAYVAVTGGAAAAGAVLHGHSLASFCAKKRTACMVGTWASTGYELSISQGSESGGAGFRLAIDDAGRSTLDLDGMAPVRVEHESGFAADITYSGTATATVTLPAATATRGVWKVTDGDLYRPLTWSMTVTVTAPSSGEIGPYSIGELAENAGELGSTYGIAVPSVSKGPLGSTGWTCTGDTMTLTPPADNDQMGTWTLRRRGPGAK